MNGVQNGYKGIGVEIIGYTKHPAKVMWDMLKQTWIQLQDIEYNPELPIVKEFITGSVDKRLNPTPQETVLIQCVFKNISRVNLAQLTRHRGWLFQVESQMPQHVEHNVVLPLNIVQSEFYERAVKLIEESQKLYDDMTKGNDDGKDHTVIPYQDARYLLMHGQTCDASCSFTLPQLVNVCGQRLETIRLMKSTMHSDFCLRSLKRQLLLMMKWTSLISWSIPRILRDVIVLVLQLRSASHVMMCLVTLSRDSVMAMSM